MEDDLFSPSPEPLPEWAFSTQLDDHGQEKFQEMSVSDIVPFLKKNNIPDEYCEKFRGIIACVLIIQTLKFFLRTT